MHLSDEDVDPLTTGTYSNSHCRFVLRNYYAAHLAPAEQAKVGYGRQEGVGRSVMGHQQWRMCEVCCTWHRLNRQRWFYQRSKGSGAVWVSSSSIRGCVRRFVPGIS